MDVLVEKNQKERDSQNVTPPIGYAAGSEWTGPCEKDLSAIQPLPITNADQLTDQPLRTAIAGRFKPKAKEHRLQLKFSIHSPIAV